MLGVCLELREDEFRFVDPNTGQILRTHQESERARQQAEARIAGLEAQLEALRRGTDGLLGFRSSLTEPKYHESAFRAHSRELGENFGHVFRRYATPPGGNCDILRTLHRIAGRRAPVWRARVIVPQAMPRDRIESERVALQIARDDEATGRCEHRGEHRMLSAVLPLRFPRGDLNGDQ